MELVKKPVMTEAKLAANRRNGRQSQGAVTEGGKARIGAAQFRHGRYSKGTEPTLCVLGEDPAELEELLAGSSPYELALEAASPPAETLRMRRVQDANMREVRRLTNLLLKIQCRKGQPKLPQAGGDKVGHDILEKEGT